MDHLILQKYKIKQLENNFKTINISTSDIDKFEKKELTKKRTFTKNTWYDWLINLTCTYRKMCRWGERPNYEYF